MIIRAQCTKKEETLTGWHVTMCQLGPTGAHVGQEFVITVENAEEFSAFAVHKQHWVEFTIVQKLK